MVHQVAEDVTEATNTSLQGNTTQQAPKNQSLSPYDNADESQQKKRAVEWEKVCGQIGSRYDGCRLSNFKRHGTAEEQSRQDTAITELRRFVNSTIANVTTGKNLVLIGPPGTGKDHLMTALMNNACGFGCSVLWKNGITLFADFRDSIKTQEPEKSLLDKYAAPDVLAISDPVPPWGEITDHQAALLFRIVDERYRRLKPIWITGNFVDGDDVKARLGSQVRDRLRHGGLAIRCDWNSYRKMNRESQAGPSSH